VIGAPSAQAVCPTHVPVGSLTALGSDNRLR